MQPTSQRPLRNPVNDADSVAQALRECGFTVLQHIDLDLDSMNTAVYNFGQMMEEGGVGLFYYSGHGIQVNGRNYLVPVSAEIQREFQVKTRCFNMDEVLGAMNEAENRVNILILDACRDNPFERRIRSSGRSGGLARMNAPSGTFIAYAPAPGRTADDGDGSNSPFTEALVKEMRTAGSTIEDVFRVVGESVERTTNQEQVPWTASSLRGRPFYFNPLNAIADSTSNTTNIGLTSSASTIITAPSRFPLHEAAGQNQIDEVRSLLIMGTEVNAQDNAGMSPLHVAARFNAQLTANLLLDQRALVNATDESGNTPLHYAVLYNAYETMEILLRHGADVNATDESGYTPLYTAASRSAHETMEILLRHGADVNAQNIYSRWGGLTPLHVAADSNARETMEILLDHGANVNALDNASNTPLHYAVFDNAYEAMEILLNHGADVNAANYGYGGLRGYTPLHYAADNNAQVTMEKLLNHDANVNATDSNANGETPLHLAATRNAYQAARILLSMGANPNAPDNGSQGRTGTNYGGYTPLHLAVRYNAYETMEILLDHGANVNAQDENGYTPLHYAASRSADETMEILLDLLNHGANVNALDEDDNTPLLLAEAENSWEIVEILRRYQRQTLRDCTECPQLVVVPSGGFTIWPPNQQEGHYVRIEYALAVGVNEVTFAEWDACVAENGCRGYVPPDESWGRGNRPVINVSWDDAQSYVHWLSQRTGHRYQLLSESEWEYVARAGENTMYGWGNVVGDNLANCDGCGSRWDNEKTAPVGSFNANAWGLHDMHGNVQEWVQDCWNDNYEGGAPSDGSAWESGSCDRRVLRGGSWNSRSSCLSVVHRHNFTTRDRSGSFNGFRVARRF